MKLLFDENLARGLVNRLAAIFPDAQHVSGIGRERASDREVWDYARESGYTIISKDSDFNQLSFLHGAPPKVIWLRVGNCTTGAIEHLLHSRLAEIAALEADDDASVLILE